METLAEPCQAPGENDLMEILGAAFFDDDSYSDNNKGSSSSKNGKVPVGSPLISSPKDGPGKVLYHCWQKTAEIFSVRFLAFEKMNFEDVYGVIIADSNYPYVIFERLFGDPPLRIDSEGYVRLTGPKRAISALDYLSLTSCLFNSRMTERPVYRDGEMWSLHHTSFDQFMCKEVMTDFGPSEVQYAVYKNSAEAILEVALIDWEGKGEFATTKVEIFGIVASRNNKVTDCRARSLLFEKKSEEAICVGFGDTIPLPLSRKVTVLPLGSILMVDLCIWHRSNKFSMDVLVDETVSFCSSLTGEVEKIVCGNRGKIKVKATWKSDISWQEIGGHL
ncbi:rRNA N-glycosidase [Rhynchospora pubera]|uniref:rRNA N-glycosidase n=1 Tax=Rhynchospora pubera TaxID=906938 RepID=A0AAV8GBI5_9POAL|nr:rRNA N-glycosidase [Rhynchospora pubera]